MSGGIDCSRVFIFMGKECLIGVGCVLLCIF